MTHLVLFACPGMPSPDVVRRYERALVPAGDVAIRWIPIPGFSSVFKAEAHRRRDNQGRVLPGLLRKWAADVPDPWSISFVGFSAGCWLGRDGLFTSAIDRKALLCSVMLDGAHTPYDGDGNPHQSELAAFMKAANDHRLIVVHSDTQTPPHGHPKGYASTTAVAKAMTAAGTRATIIHAPGSHGPVLTVHGPKVLADFLGPMLISSEPASDPRPWEASGLTWGERAVEWSLEQTKLGDVEVPPGSNAGAYIARLFAPATRIIGGSERRLGLLAGNWCAAGACAAMSATADGTAAPHGYRVSGVEIVADAKHRGTFRPPGYPPRMGDLLIITRPGETWFRHVCRVLSIDGRTCRTIGANEGQRWRITERNLDVATVCGWIVYPGLSAPVTTSFRGTSRRLDPLRDVLQPDGMDEVAALIERLGVDLVG